MRILKYLFLSIIKFKKLTKKQEVNSKFFVINQNSSRCNYICFITINIIK